MYQSYCFWFLNKSHFEKKVQRIKIFDIEHFFHSTNNVLRVSFSCFFEDENDVVYIKKHQNFFFHLRISTIRRKLISVQIRYIYWSECAITIKTIFFDHTMLELLWTFSQTFYIHSTCENTLLRRWTRWERHWWHSIVMSSDENQRQKSSSFEKSLQRA